MQTQALKIDAVAPTAQITSPADDATCCRGDVTVKVDASDAGSGVSEVDLLVDGDYFGQLEVDQLALRVHDPGEHALARQAQAEGAS